LEGNPDGACVSEDKLCLFLEQEVVNRESRASGMQQGEEGTEEEGDEEALDTLFHEIIRFSVVNSYVSAITELYVWQTKSEGKPVLPLRRAKLSALLESVRRDEDRVRRVNFMDRGLFIVTSGYDVKGLGKAIPWCWETAPTMPGSVESYLRTAAEYLLGSYPLYLLDRRF
jgi:hypothetical protein